MDGVGLSDWASGKLFGRHREAQTFSNNDVVPFDRFPYNYYDVVDPEVDLGRWTLTVEGLVKRPASTSCNRYRCSPRSCRTRGTSASRVGTWWQLWRHARLRLSAPRSAPT